MRKGKSVKNNIHVESLPDYIAPDALRLLQCCRLRQTVKHCYDNVQLFRGRMDELGITPADIKTCDDVSKLPFTQKTDLRDTYPYGLFAVDMAEVIRLHASSGTTGNPIVVGYTKADIDVWSSVMVRSFAATGIHAGDILQNAYGYGLFTGGLGAHYGAEKMGVSVVPISGGNTKRQLKIMKDFNVTAICCTPSYFIHLIDRMKAEGASIKQNGLGVGVFGAEPWTEPMREFIERESGIKAYDIYGLSEIIGPGVGIECMAQNGLHIFEDHFMIEIIDPETGDVLEEGKEGELVITTLTKQAFPMIRYRTRDITSIISEKCACGRTIRRIKRIRSRSDDMMIIRGVNVFPSQIESAILTVKQNLPHYRILLSSKDGLDQIQVQVEVTRDMFCDKISELETLQKDFAKALENTIGLRIPVHLVEPQTIERSEGKAKRVIDMRDKKD